MRARFTINRIRFLFWLGVSLGTVLLILGVVKPRWLRTRWRLIKIVCLVYVIGVALLAILQTLGRLIA